MPAPPGERRAAALGQQRHLQRCRATRCQPAPAVSAPPCRVSSIMPRPTLPLATQPWLRLMRLKYTDEGQQGQQQVPVAGPARVGGREADAQQHQVERRRTACPGARRARPGASGVGWRSRSMVRVALGGCDARCVAAHLLAGHAPCSCSKLDRGFSPSPLSLSLRWPRSSTSQRVAIRVCLVTTPLGRGHRFPRAVVGQDEDIARLAPTPGTSLLDEENARAVARGLEHAGRDTRQVTERCS